LPGRGRKIVAREKRVADRRNIAEPVDHPIDRQRRDLGAVVFRQNLTSLGAAEFGKRARDRGRQNGTAGNCGLNGIPAGCDSIYEIGVDQSRR